MYWYRLCNRFCRSCTFSFIALFVFIGMPSSEVYAQDELAPELTQFIHTLQRVATDTDLRAKVEGALTARQQAAEAERLISAKEEANIAEQVRQGEEKAAELRQRAEQLRREQEAVESDLERLRSRQQDIAEKQKALAAEITSIADSLAWLTQAINKQASLPSDQASRSVDTIGPPQEATQPPATSAPQENAPVSPSAPTTAASTQQPAVAVEEPNFNKEVRPILANNCFACHGPDEKARKASLRLDDPQCATSLLPSGNIAIKPGNRLESALYQRITCTDPEHRMPPADSGKTLKPHEIEILGKWIDSGAKYVKHWAFVPPTRPEPPSVQHEEWVRNDIDRFIVDRLEKEGLTPQPEADKRTLIRRLSLDLTGLPPTPEEIQAFLDDTAPDAYERCVDRLLASPAHGEHMARYWLDLSRYADTNGYHIDNERYMWRWRDWVIEAFNRNMPFDEFTRWQLAGDLLPNATREQKLATGFNRNHMITFEGGIIPEEYRVAYVNDRVVTVGTVWMGLTLNCASCHDHKYDPISQKEFYQLTAFFNSIPEQGSDGNKGNAVPFMPAPLPEQEERLAALDAQIRAKLDYLHATNPEWDAQQAAWETEIVPTLARRWQSVMPSAARSQGGAETTVQSDGSVVLGGQNPDKDVVEITFTAPVTQIFALRTDVLPNPTSEKATLGRSENGNFVLTHVEALVTRPGEEARTIAFAAAETDYAQEGFSAENVIDPDPKKGWAVLGSVDQPHALVLIPVEPLALPAGSTLTLRFHFASEFPQHVFGRFRVSVSDDSALAPMNMSPWYVNGPFLAENGDAAYDTAYEPEQCVDLKAAYPDGRLKWVLAKDWQDGAVHDLYGDVAATYLYREITVPTDRNAVFAVQSNDAVKVWVNGEVVHDNKVQRAIEKDKDDKVSVRLRAGKNAVLLKVVNYGNAYAFAFRKAKEQVLNPPLEVEIALAKPAEQREDKEKIAILEYFRSTHIPEWQAMQREYLALRDEKKALEEKIPTVMVMQEMEKPRETFVLRRGQYDQPTERVEADTPAFLPPFPKDAPKNRLGFAEWLLDPKHPLTARVVVNRFWAQLFGHGIVRTVEDFGVQGELPTHPELLDWLATEFIRMKWDVKQFMRLLVTSAAYRRSAVATPVLLEHDPENRLLARGPRFRMDAEMVRDNALAISGLLVTKIGGPSVKPYQPPRIWEDVSFGDKSFTAQTYEQDTGPALYRRSMYTFWKRQAPPPTLVLFDAPNREVCTARRARTNTPLQALALMNDVTFVEAARVLAERCFQKSGGDVTQAIRIAFERATARPPDSEEMATLYDLFTAQREVYSREPDAAEKLLSAGESPRDAGIPAADLAALTTVTSVILNLDETVTKT